MSFLIPYPDLRAERVGNTDTPGVWHFDSGLPGRHVLITALLHGNELCGAWALKDMLAAGVRPRRGSLTLAFGNLAAYDRFDAARHDASRFVDEDMNRVWSDERLAEPATQERRRAAELAPWVARADLLLDLHSMHEPGAPLLLTGTLPRNVALARRLGAPAHVVVDAGHKDGVRMRDYGRFGSPEEDACALLIECGFHGDPASHAVALDMCARLLVEAGCMDAGDLPAAWRLPTPTMQRVLEVTDAVVAPSMEVRFAHDWQGLETLEKAGTVLGWADGVPIETPYDDCTLIMPSLRQLKPGVTVVRLARDYVR
ncbi:succinylglutamate desuccinylase/aspartoacylase family protein [Bordetella genomosp. 13]|uniref:succinylglutamate desuccinylase/aspartoacylase domain-containing protein n=1 Tax=Bordetella genomosp. 13 TaxID=463040 RepID=UPI00119F0AF3|nr:succinylglutamate desuccinylase/aspartoacylase family protein [Bordetella genomosp. 13]